MAQKVVILFAGRFPSEKAAAIFVDLNARALTKAGSMVTVLAPRRLGRARLGTVPYSVKYLPTIDLSRIPVVWEIANAVSVYVFAKWAYMWLVLRSHRDDVVISNDAWPLLIATLVRRNTLYEMHDFPDRSLWMYRLLFKRVRWILVTNEWKRKEMMRLFPEYVEKLILERNAVDVEVFGTVSKADARSQLGLSPHQDIVVYTGHLYEWKGADTLAKAAAGMTGVTFIFVGGTTTDVDNFTARYGQYENIRIIGHVPHDQIPLWQSAADVLVLPNSAKEEISVHYTSPMKLFEYMASDRPIVASDLPSIREVLPADVGYFARPDNPDSLAQSISEALRPDAVVRASRARGIVEQYTWAKRAQRILSRL